MTKDHNKILEKNSTNNSQQNNPNNELLPKMFEALMQQQKKTEDFYERQQQKNEKKMDLLQNKLEIIQNMLLSKKPQVINSTNVQDQPLQMPLLEKMKYDIEAQFNNNFKVDLTNNKINIKTEKKIEKKNHKIVGENPRNYLWNYDKKQSLQNKINYYNNYLLYLQKSHPNNLRLKQIKHITEFTFEPFGYIQDFETFMNNILNQFKLLAANPKDHADKISEKMINWIVNYQQIIQI